MPRLLVTTFAARQEIFPSARANTPPSIATAIASVEIVSPLARPTTALRPAPAKLVMQLATRIQAISSESESRLFIRSGGNDSRRSAAHLKANAESPATNTAMTTMTMPINVSRDSALLPTPNPPVSLAATNANPKKPTKSSNITPSVILR